MKDKKEKDLKLGEDATNYGEFISSCFAWIPLPDLKRKAERLEQIEKKDEKQEKRIK